MPFENNKAEALSQRRNKQSTAAAAACSRTDLYPADSFSSTEPHSPAAPHSTTTLSPACLKTLQWYCSQRSALPLWGHVFITVPFSNSKYCFLKHRQHYSVCENVFYSCRIRNVSLVTDQIYYAEEEMHVLFVKVFKKI